MLLITILQKMKQIQKIPTNVKLSHKLDSYIVVEEVGYKSEAQVGFSLPLALATIVCCPFPLNTM